MSSGSTQPLLEAKERLDLIINKARVDLYKPIQIAEVLYKSRIGTPGLNISDLESYRARSKTWRDEVSRRLLGKASTSSARFQDNIWEANAMTPQLLAVLDQENRATNGDVEKYIYTRFQERQLAVTAIITIVETAEPSTFDISSLFEIFQTNQAVRRSVDKVYEVVVYSLMETIVVELDAQVTVSVPDSKRGLLTEFSDLAYILLGLSNEQMQNTLPAHVYRVGVTNAADRGLDMWANFGPAIQVKHLTLDPKLAENIVDQIESDNVIVVCRTADKQTLQIVLSQISWGSRVRSIVTETDLEKWYERCLRGKYADFLATKLLERLSTEFKKEFPQAAEIVTFLEERNYLETPSVGIWQINLLRDLKTQSEN